MIEAKLDSRALERKLRRLEGAAFDEFAQAVVNGATVMHASAMSRRLKSGEANLQMRSGALARSVRTTPARKRGGFWEGSSRIGQGAPYAGAHEPDTPGQKTRTIVPREKQFLTVPFGAARTPGGDFRQAAKIRRSGKRFYTSGDVPGSTSRRTFIYETGSGQKIVAVPGRGERPLGLYVLKKRVKLPTRLGFVSTFRKLASKRRTLYSTKLRRFLETRG